MNERSSCAGSELDAAGNDEESFASRMCARFAAAWREMAGACGAFEWVALCYLAVSGMLIAAFHKNLAAPALHLALRVTIAAAIFAICVAARRSRSGAIRFARHWYPQALFLFCFEELHHIVHVIFPGWFDRYLIGFDYRLTGVNPTVWLQQFARPWLNDFMQMAYLTYFFYLIVLGAILFRTKNEHAFWSVMTGSIAAYSIGYLIALLFPIESPYHTLRALHTVELEGGFFTSLIGVIEKLGRVHGAAFPSAHVCGSFVAVLGAWRYRRWLFWVYLPLFLCMMVATVYGRYHYVADVFAGLLTGAIGFWLGEKLVRLRSRQASAGCESFHV
jgi:membrane-associated phospholipid phosphatase